METTRQDTEAVCGSDPGQGWRDEGASFMTEEQRLQFNIDFQTGHIEWLREMLQTSREDHIAVLKKKIWWQDTAIGLGASCIGVGALLGLS